MTTKVLFPKQRIALSRHPLPKRSQRPKKHIRNHNYQSSQMKYTSTAWAAWTQTRGNPSKRGTTQNDIEARVGTTRPSGSQPQNGNSPQGNKHRNREHPTLQNKSARVLGTNFIAAATRNDQNVHPLVKFVKKRDWEALKLSFGQNWYNIRHCLHVWDDCLPIDERIVLPTQLRQTVLDSLHLTHPGSAAILYLCQHIWFPHIHRSI